MPEYERDAGRCWGGKHQNGEVVPTGDACPDNTHKIDQPGEGKDCALTCEARDGRWAGETICLEEKYICDDTLQCAEGEDEAPVRDSCRKEYIRKKIFLPGETFPCTTHTLDIPGSPNPFAPLRGIPCDRVPQCPGGEDESGCDPGYWAIVFLGDVLNDIIRYSFYL